jgi:hypothetical protein
LETRLAEHAHSNLLFSLAVRGHFYCGEHGDISIVV